MHLRPKLGPLAWQCPLSPPALGSKRKVSSDRKRNLVSKSQEPRFKGPGKPFFPFLSLKQTTPSSPPPPTSPGLPVAKKRGRVQSSAV